MIDRLAPLLVEGFESALLPCSLVLLIPGAAVAVAARQESSSALTGFAFGTVALSWLRFSDRGGDLSTGLVALLLAITVTLLAFPLLRRFDLVSGAGGALAGSAAGVLWVPCVGEEFGLLLGQLPTSGVEGFALFVAYAVGVLAPLAALGAILHLIPNRTLILARPLMLLSGGGVLAALALATAVGLSDELISRLVEWSVT